MTKSTITIERLEKIKSWRETYGAGSNVMLPAEEAEALALIALAAMDSEPVAYIDKQWTLVYYVPPMSMGLKIGDKLYRHAQPAPVSYSDFEEFWSAYIHPLAQDDELKDFSWGIWNACVSNSQPAPVVPLVPDDVLDALRKVARIRLDLNDFDGDRRGIADCLCDAEEALIEVVNRCAAMLAAYPQSPGGDHATVPGKWIPVSERMPDVGVKVLCFPAKDEPIHATFNGQLWLQDVSWSGSEEPIDNVIPVTVTHWMPLPAGPQEVR
ncbi:DUF551 domain-containing protein [Klebsiella pneumoniae]